MASTQRSSEPPRRVGRPAKTNEGRESQLVSLAIDLAEKQIRDGTASAQVVTHFLKLGTQREMLEREKLAGENQLLGAKIEAMASAKRIEELYEGAITAMRRYSGQEPLESDRD